MTEEQKNELGKRLWEAEKCLQNIYEAERFIDEIERYGIKVSTASGADLAGHLDKESYQAFRDLVISRLQRTINDNKVKFESL